MNASNQLARTERFRHVVVCPYPKSHENVRLAVAGGQHDHGNRPVGLDSAANFESVETRQHQIQHDDIWIYFFTECDGRRSVAGTLDPESFLPQSRRDRG
jgi:hypothetical protein